MAPLKPRSQAKIRTPPAVISEKVAQQEALAAAEEQKIQELMHNADEDLVGGAYTHACDQVIQNLVKVLEAINKRERRNYAVVNFSMELERVLRERAEEESRRVGGKEGIWFLKPYCEMGRTMINRLRYDRSHTLIEVTDTNDPKLVVEKLAADAGANKKKGVGKASLSLGASSSSDAKKRKREEQLAKRGTKSASKVGAGSTDISPTSVTNLEGGGAKGRKRPRSTGSIGGGGDSAAGGSDDEEAPVTTLLVGNKRKLKLKGGGGGAPEHRKSISSTTSMGDGSATTATTTATGGGNRIIIPGKKSTTATTSSSTKFKIPIKAGGTARATPSSTNSDQESSGNNPSRSRESLKEEKLKKAQKLVNDKRRRDAEEEERQKEAMEKKAEFNRKQKEHLKKQQEALRRKQEEEARRHEREKAERAARREKARKERESMQRTIDFDTDARALEELQRYNVNPYGTNLTREIDWDLGEGESEPFQGESSYYRPINLIRA